MNKLILKLLLLIVLASCASKLPKSKQVTVFADKLEIAVIESSDGLKFKTLDGTELYRHTPVKANQLIGYVEKSLELERKYKNDRRHSVDERKDFYKENGVAIGFSYKHSNKTSYFMICYMPENVKGNDPLCEATETIKAKRMIEPLKNWKEIKKELN